MGGIMRLKNKKTGEIADLSEGVITDTYGGEKIQIKPVAISNKEGYVYSSLAELNEEWEDYEEPEVYWWIDTGSIPMVRKSNNPILSTAEDIDKEIGNYFETQEKAELAVRKLKAWKRLEDDDFKFECWYYDVEPISNGRLNIQIRASLNESDKSTLSDLDLLFGGEE
jgi:hypothetical protein